MIMVLFSAVEYHRFWCFLQIFRPIMQKRAVVGKILFLLKVAKMGLLPLGTIKMTKFFFDYAAYFFALLPKSYHY